MLTERIENPGARVEIVTLRPEPGPPQAGLVHNWKAPEEAYIAGNRAWLPCTEAFYWEMLEVLPPIYLGTFWAVSEAWRHDARGQEVLLWFRGRPENAACRIATRDEIRKEKAP